ncbi:MAG: hypothetical protein KA361_03395 [Chromatiaceae bacterium]|jgi:hypothetical protein|nr:hypothetical protein [Chromatiaceae bacterium]MBP7983314.1 hypothetical protein [Chromatiaceae bacterium]
MMSRHLLPLAVLLPLLLAPCLGVGASSKAAKLPPIWGYGVKSCTTFLAAADGREAGDALQDLEFQRYEDWLTGFITGLNLSMGKDVLVGADINGALKRIHAYCQGHGKEDVFTATMDLVRMLGRLK